MKFANVSVVIPYYNNSSTISRTLSSIYNQTVLPKEVIIVDDNSKKNENKKLKNILNKYNNKKINKILINKKKNSGPATARNIGWNKSSCKYIAFLDSDDSWHIKKIELQYNIMEKNKLSFTSHYSTSKYSNTFNNYKNNNEFKKISLLKMLFFNQFTTPTVMLLRNINLRFEDKKYYTEDYLLWLEILISGTKMYLIKKTLTYLHKPSIGFSGLSKNINAMRKGELDSFYILFKKKKINKFLFSILVIYSHIKSLRRTIFINGIK